MTSEGLGEMFEGDSAETCSVKFPLVSMGGRAEGLACTDPGARTPIGASGNLSNPVIPETSGRVVAIVYTHTVTLFITLGSILST
jgi:hypothetical protein